LQLPTSHPCQQQQQQQQQQQKDVKGSREKETKSKIAAFWSVLVNHGRWYTQHATAKTTANYKD
jgi:hypothetical protein